MRLYFATASNVTAKKHVVSDDKQINNKLEKLTTLVLQQASIEELCALYIDEVPEGKILFDYYTTIDPLSGKAKT